jgi:hypothetical protein
MSLTPASLDLANMPDQRAPKVLLLSTYTFGEPRHGGQVRLANIARAYHDAGFQVHSVAVCENQGPDFGKDDVLFSKQAPHNLFDGEPVLFSSDFLSGRYAINPQGAWPEMRKRFMNESIQAIHVEQPWMWPLAMRLKELPSCANAVLVYGSQNIEAPLRQEILQAYGQQSENFIQAITRLERQASQEAHIAVAVTQEDATVLQSFGAQRILLAPNGIAPWSADPANLARWKKKLPQPLWALYIASAHPPNFTGFLDCVGQALGGIPPDSRLVVAGSVGEPLQEVLARSRWSNLNLARTQYLGMLSDADLAAVKSLAGVYCLPIAYGGGSNIKTAEAIYSGAQVIGSPAAFRGFEDFLGLPQIHVAHNPSQFQAYLRELLMSDAPVVIPEAERALRARLEWSQCLAGIPKAVLTYL